MTCVIVGVFYYWSDASTRLVIFYTAASKDILWAPEGNICDLSKVFDMVSEIP